MSFRAYVQKRRITDTPAGDFVDDARYDKTLPDAATWEKLKSYLRCRNACPGAIKAAKQVWRGYEASQRRQGKGPERGREATRQSDRPRPGFIVPPPMMLG